MIRPTDDEPPAPRALPTPHITRTRWILPLVWIAPLLAAALAAFYGYTHLRENGQQIVIRFTDGSGLKEGQTIVTHLGVQIGRVTAVDLSDDKQQVRVTVSLRKSQEAFAKQGAVYWTVRPQISIESVSGLSTVLSGPYIEASPGTGPATTEFDGLQRSPVNYGPGINLVLHSPRIEHLSADGPVYYRGIEVGTIKDVELSPDAAGVDVSILIRHRYTALVQSDSKFWIVKAADIKGGLFSGVQFKLGSLQSLFSGGVSFATPETEATPLARDGDSFPLYDDAKKDWLDWSPHIALPADDMKNSDQPIDVPPVPVAAPTHAN
jgi:paraquat-inducible protein B